MGRPNCRFDVLSVPVYLPEPGLLIIALVFPRWSRVAELPNLQSKPVFTAREARVKPADGHPTFLSLSILSFHEIVSSDGQSPWTVRQHTLNFLHYHDTGSGQSHLLPRRIVVGAPIGIRHRRAQVSVLMTRLVYLG